LPDKHIWCLPVWHVVVPGGDDGVTHDYCGANFATCGERSRSACTRDVHGVFAHGWRDRFAEQKAHCAADIIVSQKEVGLGIRLIYTLADRVALIGIDSDQFAHNL
jgi:hypothetical protein